jgi:flavin-dependent dehydrogenase
MSSDRSRSIVEMVALSRAAPSYDVVILGGGLAGLTLAIQLKRTRPQTSVLVLEKREGPAPLAAFKVGESTVPAGAHYFAEIVGMKDHLLEHQLRKCGLRYFLPEGDNSELVRRREVGPIRYPPHDNFQIDRGLFENELAVRARAAGADVLQGCRAGEVGFGDESHTVSFTALGDDTTVQARWVVDAAGRASLLKRKLGLGTDVGHVVNAAWLRLGGGLDIEDFGRHDTAWMERMSEPGLRKFSTNHLFGEGYWMWLIPLSSGPTSIGVCADANLHPFEEISELDRFMGWLGAHEPQLAAAIEPRMEQIEDFLRVEDFAYGVERVFSPERWCLVGEAGAFSDPLYSPGSDFIAYSNLFSCDLIARDLDGEAIGARVERYNDLYLRTFAGVMSRTENLYPVFGNAWVFAAKLSWDSYCNHGGVTLLMVKNKLTDLDFMDTVEDDLDRLYRLDLNTQRLFGEWNELDKRPLPGGGEGQKQSRFMLEALGGMAREYSDEELRGAIQRNVQVCEALSVAYFHLAAEKLAERPPEDRPLNPYAIGLQPERWEEEGMFDAPGLTNAAALEVVGGIEVLFS